MTIHVLQSLRGSVERSVPTRDSQRVRPGKVAFSTSVVTGDMATDGIEAALGVSQGDGYFGGKERTNLVS